jgi:bacterioferritin
MIITQKSREEVEISKEQFLDELNKDVEWEFAAAIQYIQHSSVITGAQYMEISEEMMEHARQEIDHAKILSELIDQLGGTPTTGIENIKVSKRAEEMLRQDLDYERDQIDRYALRMKQAEYLNLYDVFAVVGGILAQEREHERDLMMALGE